MGLLFDDARDIIAKSYQKLGDLTLLRMRNHKKGFGRSEKQKRLYLQSRIIILNLRSVLDHVAYDVSGNVSYLLRTTPAQLNRFLKTLESAGELDKYSVAPLLFHKGKPYIKNIGKDAPLTQVQYSADGTTWHTTYLSGDYYLRISTDGGVTFSPAVLFLDYPLINSKVAKAGDTMTGALAMSNNKITGLGNGTNAADAINKSQMEDYAAQMEDYANSLVVGLWDDRGTFSAAGGNYPSIGGSGTAGAIKKGDIWTISVAGTLPTGQVVEIGDTVRALIDTPGNTQANWSILQNNLGYVPLNRSGDSMTGPLNMVGNQINNLPGATSNGQAVRFEQLAPLAIPAGVIVMWAGTIAPSGWGLCDGSQGRPDLRGMFIVGYDPSDTDYDTIGKSAGEKKHALGINEMPAHNHNTGSFDKLLRTSIVGEFVTPTGYDSGGSGTELMITAGGQISPSGGDVPHENRPPYYTLAYIIKL